MAEIVAVLLFLDYWLAGDFANQYQNLLSAFPTDMHSGALHPLSSSVVYPFIPCLSINGGRGAISERWFIAVSGCEVAHFVSYLTTSGSLRLFVFVCHAILEMRWCIFYTGATLPRVNEQLLPMPPPT